jgi:hypothetical protein
MPGVTIRYLSDDEKTKGTVEATERLYTTDEPGVLVPHGHLDARTLFCVPGMRFNLGDALAAGLVAKKGKPEKKESKPAETKVKKPAKKKS